MRPVLLTSLALIALAWMFGCTQSSSSSIGGTVTSPSALSGQYAFVLSGYDSTSNPMSMAGSFKADGLGHITAGEIDVNDNGTVSSNVALTGTYAFDSAGQGTIGTITLTNTVGSVTHPLAFGFALQASGAFGNIMSLDANNFIISGTMQQQNTSAFTLAGLAGDFIITLNGRNASAPTSALGRFTLGSSGLTTNISFDRSISGIGTAGPTTTSIVTFAAAGPNTNGRGTFVVGFNDALTTVGTQNFAYYAITANRFVAVEIDNVATMIADGSRQSTPFTATTVNTTGSAFGIAGVDAVTTGEISAAGQLQVSGTSTGTLAWDSNDNGTLVAVPTLASQAVAFNSATGRGTVTINNGFTNGLANSLVFYLTAPGTGFLMDTTAGTSNRAMAGTLTAQTGTSFSAAADLAGLAIVRSRGVAASNAQAFVAEFGPTTASTYAFIADQRFPSSGNTVQDSKDASITGITVGSLSATTGRGTLLSGSETLAFYVIGPNQFVFIDISPVSSGLNGPSSLFFATPD